MQSFHVIHRQWMNPSGIYNEGLLHQPSKCFAFHHALTVLKMFSMQDVSRESRCGSIPIFNGYSGKRYGAHKSLDVPRRNGNQIANLQQSVGTQIEESCHALDGVLEYPTKNGTNNSDNCRVHRILLLEVQTAYYYNNP